MTHFKDVEELFRRHVMDGETIKVSSDFRKRLENTAIEVYDSCPVSAERTLAIRKLHDALMAINLALSMHGVAR